MEGGDSMKIEAKVTHYSIDIEDFMKKQSELIIKLKNIGRIIEQKRKGEWAYVVIECRESDVERVEQVIHNFSDDYMPITIL